MKHTMRARLHLMQRRVRRRLLRAIPFALFAGCLFVVLNLLGYGAEFRRTGVPTHYSLDDLWRPFFTITFFVYLCDLLWPFPWTTRDFRIEEPWATSSGPIEEPPPNPSPLEEEGANAGPAPPSRRLLTLFLSLWFGLTIYILACGFFLELTAFLLGGSAREILEIAQIRTFPLGCFFPSFLITPSTGFLALVGIVSANSFINAIALTAVLKLVQSRLDPPMTRIDLSGTDSGVEPGGDVL